VAKLSISIPDELAEDIHDLAPLNVSAFVSTAIRHEIDRRALFAFLDELEDELGPVDEDEVAVFNEAFSSVQPKEPSPPRRPGPRARSSASAQTRSRSLS